ncbi:ABC transporter permease [Bordetella holmesii]|nr:ABC transporter permease [Bordetella holmesii]
MICERAGVLNLGIEGIMVVGAFTGWLAVYLGAPLYIGVLAAALAGAIFGLLHAVLTVPLGLSQHVSGLGVTMLATSLSYFAYRVTFPKVETPPTIVPYAEMKGSSRNTGECRPDLEEEVLLIAVAVGAALDDFDGVVDALDDAGVEPVATARQNPVQIGF